MSKSVLTIQRVAMLKFNSVHEHVCGVVCFSEQLCVDNSKNGNVEIQFGLRIYVWGIVFLVSNSVLTSQRMAMLKFNSVYENVCGASFLFVSKSVLSIQRLSMLKFNSVYERCVWGIVFLVISSALTIQRMSMLKFNSV